MYGSYRVNEQRDLDERLSLYCSHDDLHLYNCSVKILHVDSKELAGYDDPAGDVLSDQFDHERALQAMHADDRVIADLLLGQDIFGGIGNILKNEVLFATHVHPASHALAINREKATSIIDSAVELAGAWYRDKQAGRQPERTIYRQAICPTCVAQVPQKKIGVYDRITFFCKECQHHYSG
jgi:endonuclease-8